MLYGGAIWLLVLVGLVLCAYNKRKLQTRKGPSILGENETKSSILVAL